MTYPRHTVCLLIILALAVTTLVGCRPPRLPRPPVVVDDRHPRHHPRVRHHRYRYFPASEIYFDIDRKLYFYLGRNGWVEVRVLPRHIYIDIDNYVIVDLEGPKPHVYHKSMIKRYPPQKYKKKKRQEKRKEIRRESRKGRYYDEPDDRRDNRYERREEYREDKRDRREDRREERHEYRKEYREDERERRKDRREDYREEHQERREDYYENRKEYREDRYEDRQERREEREEYRREEEEQRGKSKGRGYGGSPW